MVKKYTEEELSNLIKLHHVPDEERLDFLPLLASSYFMQFESMLYSHADKFISGYSGAYWHYVNYNLNGHKIMFAYPDFADVVSMVNHDNYYEGTMTSIECGLSLTIFVLNKLIWKAYNSKQHELQRKLQQHYDILQTFSQYLPHRSEIYKFLD